MASKKKKINLFLFFINIFLLLFLLVKKILPFFFSEDENIKLLKKQKEITKKEIKELKKQIKKLNNKRGNLRDKYSKIVSIILIIIFLFPVINYCHYYKYFKDEGVLRDFGNYTNYIKYLEEENKLLKSTVTLYSNIVIKQSNIIYIEKTEKEFYKKQYKKSLFSQYLYFGVSLLLIIIHIAK